MAEAARSYQPSRQRVGSRRHGISHRTGEQGRYRCAVRAPVGRISSRSCITGTARVALGLTVATFRL